MKTGTIVKRRTLLQTGAAALAVPAVIRTARAAGGAIRIGVPTALTGTYANMGEMVRRTCNMVAKEVQARGGVLGGRQLEFLFEDTGGVPANCVRKAQEMVERGEVTLFTGIMASSEALAVSAKLPEWNALFMSSINGAGELTAEKFVPNFFRANVSAPMGSRAISLYLKNAPQKRFFGIAVDQAWGNSSLKVFEAETQKNGKEFVGKVTAPTGTRDYSTYIARIRQENPDGVYVVLAGDDATTFYQQAAEFHLTEKVQMFTELVDLMSIRPPGDATLGLIGASRYCFTIDNPKNAAFVKNFRAINNDVPDTYDGEQYNALQMLLAGIEKAGSTDTKALITALDGLEIDGIKGKDQLRECDHQGVQHVFVVQVVKGEDVPGPAPKIIETFAPDQVVPPCRKSSFS
ncbi:MAG: ABC transporter substrate-binding protein [Alphaproteobacteria bacterium]|nr:ABC transporter substrate-binding protein [Alphaproteobacteria bacterium]